MEPLLIVIALALLATVFTLVMGLFLMGAGGAMDQTFSTPLMWARVGLQGFTCALLIGAILLHGSA